MKNDDLCRGCNDDFYNGRNPHGIEKCWSIESATIETRYRLHINSVPTKRSNFKTLQRPDCYREKGFVFYTKIPSFAK